MRSIFFNSALPACGGHSAFQRGAALLAVLWLTVVLSFMALALSTTARTEVQATRNLVESERGYFLACGGLQAALSVLTSPPPTAPSGEENSQGAPRFSIRPQAAAEHRQAAFRPGQREMVFEFETGTATVEVMPETGKLNVNGAPVPVLAKLFVNLGLAEQDATELAQMIDHWRRPASSVPDELDRFYAQLSRRSYQGVAHRKIGTLAELLWVRGMTKDLLYGGLVRTSSGSWRRPPLRELLTVHNPGLAVDANYAHPLVLASLPGVSAEAAAAIVAARNHRPFRSMEEVLAGVPGILPGESLSYLALTAPSAFTLVTHGRAKDAELDRSVRLLFERDSRGPLGYRLLEWDDRN